MGYLYRPKHPPKGTTYAVAKAEGTLQESSVWWVKYYVNGVPRRESTGKTKETEARRFLKSREGKVSDGQPVLPRVDKIMYTEIATDLRDHYETTGDRVVAEADVRLAHLNKFFATYRVVAITGDAATRYIKSRQSCSGCGKTTPHAVDETDKHVFDGAANGTINRELSTLGRMLKLAYEHGKLLRLPIIRKLKEAPPREGFVTHEQFQAIYKSLPAELQVAALVAFTFGWRKREVLDLELRHLDLKASEYGTLTLDPGTTKNDDGRVVHLTPELHTALVGQVAVVRNLERKLGQIIPSLFPHLEGPLAGDPIRDPRKAWATACKAAGRPGTRIHDLRRSAVRIMEQASVPRSVAMKLTGHRTETVYRRYAIVSPADLQEASRRISGITTGITDSSATK